MLMRVAALAAATALSSIVIQFPASAQTSGAPATGWWYAGQSGQAPQRQLAFIDRSTMQRTGDAAGTRAMLVFEQSRGDVRAFAITYAFQCGARRYQSRDALFTTTAGRHEPENGIIDDWSSVAPNSVAALILDATCNGRFDSAARRIAATPAAEAERIFHGPPQLATPSNRNTSRQPPPPAPASNAAAVASSGLASVVCRGTVYIDGQPETPFEARVSLGGGQASVRFVNSSAFGLSGSYSYGPSTDGSYRITLRDGSMAYHPSNRTFAVSFMYYWEEDDLDPNNPFPVELSARIDYRGTCS